MTNESNQQQRNNAVILML